MKINYDYYKGEDLYSDGTIEQEIISYLEKYGEENIEEVFKEDMRWPVFYHLTKIRQNIINWYPFKENAEVLEIGAGMGAITGALCDKANFVTSVELSKQRATSIATRTKHRKNLEIIVGNFNDIQFHKKFDYITLIGVLEYAGMFTDSKQPFEDFLAYIMTLLKEDGKLLIAIENKLGMKYFAGAAEDHSNIPYDGITGYQKNKKIQTFGKQELKSLLQQVGLCETNFYYPLPDYKLPLCIYSDKRLPTEKEIENDYLPYYYADTVLNFDEKLAYKEVIRNGCFDIFSNSFFVEASKIPQEITVQKQVFKPIVEEKMTQPVKDFFHQKYPIEKEVMESKNTKIYLLEKEAQEKIDTLNGIYQSRSWKWMQKIKKIIRK